jgi:hypothetical protein
VQDADFSLTENCPAAQLAQGLPVPGDAVNDPAVQLLHAGAEKELEVPAGQSSQASVSPRLKVPDWHAVHL